MSKFMLIRSMTAYRIREAIEKLTDSEVCLLHKYLVESVLMCGDEFKDCHNQVVEMAEWGNEEAKKALAVRNKIVNYIYDEGSKSVFEMTKAERLILRALQVLLAMYPHDGMAIKREIAEALSEEDRGNRMIDRGTL